MEQLYTAPQLKVTLTLLSLVASVDMIMEGVLCIPLVEELKMIHSRQSYIKFVEEPQRQVRQ